MKTGKTLNELAAAITEQAKAKKDYIADTSALVVAPKKTADGDAVKGAIEMHGLNGDDLIVGETAHEQLASHLKIPKQYYDRMRVEQPDLLAANVNTWLKAQPERRMVRTLFGKVRAFLSDRYRPLDNFDLANVILPIVHDVGAEIVSCEITERRLYVKTVLPSLRAEIKSSKRVGEVVVGGVMFSNSEIGEGSLRAEGFADILVCLNGMVRTDLSMRKYHVGKKAEDLPEVVAAFEHFTSKTRQLDDAAFWSKVKDIAMASFEPEAFFAWTRTMDEAAQSPIVSRDLPKVVEVTRRRFSLSEETGQSILFHLAKDGDFSKWGLANAITRTAEDEESYDDATSLERIGGQVIELAPTDWKVIAEAA